MEERFVTKYEVVAYDEGGYGDDRSMTFDDEAQAVKYASSLEGRFGATVWRRTLIRPLPEDHVKIWPPTN